MKYTVLYHDRTTFNTDDLREALVQAFRDSCCTYDHVPIFEGDDLVAQVKAEAPA